MTSIRSDCPRNVRLDVAPSATPTGAHRRVLRQLERGQAPQDTRVLPSALLPGPCARPRRERCALARNRHLGHASRREGCLGSLRGCPSWLLAVLRSCPASSNRVVQPGGMSAGRSSSLDAGAYALLRTGLDGPRRRRKSSGVAPRWSGSIVVGPSAPCRVASATRRGVPNHLASDGGEPRWEEADRRQGDRRRHHRPADECDRSLGLPEGG